MALMLRMLGIPSRVAAGFAPGGRDPERNNWLVDDTDAHNWVEVFFPGIGWTTFEPTPPGAPAATQLDDNALGVTNPALPTNPNVSGQNSTDPRGGDIPLPKPQTGVSARHRQSSSGPGTWTILGAGAGLAALAALGAYALRIRRRRRLDADELADAELRELDRALARVGSPLAPGTTLQGVREFLNRFAGPGAARYAARLETHRYRDPGASPPGVADRRALRRALLRAAGLRSALRVLIAVPPGGPAIRRRERAGWMTRRPAPRRARRGAGASAAPG
jgi:transglutaminase superfamily protein